MRASMATAVGLAVLIFAIGMGQAEAQQRGGKGRRPCRIPRKLVPGPPRESHIRRSPRRSRSKKPRGSDGQAGPEEREAQGIRQGETRREKETHREGEGEGVRRKSTPRRPRRKHQRGPERRARTTRASRGGAPSITSFMRPITITMGIVTGRWSMSGPPSAISAPPRRHPIGPERAARTRRSRCPTPSCARRGGSLETTRIGSPPGPPQPRVMVKHVCRGRRHS